MNLSLPPRIQKLIDDRVSSGKYISAEDVVVAAVASLDQQEQWAELEAGELDDLMAKGEDSGAALDGEEVLSELRGLRQQDQSKAG